MFSVSVRLTAVCPDLLAIISYTIISPRKMTCESMRQYNTYSILKPLHSVSGVYFCLTYRQCPLRSGTS